MSTVNETAPVLDEAVWEAWLQKGKRQEQATMRKARIFGVIVVILAVLASAVYALRGQAGV
jgi:hypothetical protein